MIASETSFGATKNKFAERQLLVEIMLHNFPKFVQLAFRFLPELACVRSSLSKSNEASLSKAFGFLFRVGLARSNL